MIVKNNIIIAEFMGVEFNSTRDKCNHSLIKAPWPPIECLLYHSSWSWLMPVLDKICRTMIGDGIKYVEFAYPRTFGTLNEETGQIMVRFNGFQLFQSDTLIEATYLAIIDFIEWYNKA